MSVAEVLAAIEAVRRVPVSATGLPSPEERPALAEAEPPDPNDPGPAFSPEFRRRMIRSGQKGEAIIQARVIEDRLYTLSNDTVAELRTMIEQARKDTIEAMSRATKEWAYADRKAVLDSLDTTMARLEAQMSSSLRNGQQTTWDMGTEVMSDIERSMNMTMSTKPYIDTAVLSTAMQMTPELITNVTSQIKRDVASIIRLGALGQRSPLDMMKQMGKVTGKGPWSSAFLRGEVIYRTEMGRTFQLANQARLRGHFTEDPTWKKKWVSVHDSRTRPSHERADGQVRSVDEPYDVGDSKLMFPHDPNGSAKETINCRCMSIPWRDEWERLDRPEPETPEDRWEDEFDRTLRREVDDATARAKKWWDDYKKFLDAEPGEGYARQIKADNAASVANGGAYTLIGNAAMQRIRDALKSVNLTRLSADQTTAMMTRLNAMSRRLRAEADDLMRGIDRSKEYADPATRAATTRAGILRETAMQLEIAALKAQLNLPLESRVKPRPSGGKSQAMLGSQRIYDTILELGKWLESIGLKTAWSGGVKYGGAGRYAGVYNWGDIAINANTLKYRADNYEKVLLHETLHGVSHYYDNGSRGDYAKLRGWEEGVVEGLTQALMAKRGGNPYSTYKQYTAPLETLRGYVGMDAETFYTSLIRTPLAQRPDWVRDRLEGLREPTRTEALRYLTVATKGLARK